MSTLDRDATAIVAAPKKDAAARAHPALRSLVRVGLTLLMVAIAATLGVFAWRAYMGTPWTRDGTVRAYVVKIAPQVPGQIVDLPVRDNQFVHKGDLLMQVDPASYTIAVRQAQAAVQQAKAQAQNADAEWARRQKLNDLAVTLEEQQTYASKSLSALAQYQAALADLDTARLNLKRTRIVSPVNGYVTNLQAQTGDYANVGGRTLALIDADSYWVDAYFEETFLSQIHEGDAAKVKFMGYPQVLRGRVESVSRGISVANAAASPSGLAEVNPVFTFVRLAQRVPVRIHLESVPNDLRLVAGMTATVTIEAGDKAAAGSAETTTRVAATATKAAVAPAGGNLPAAMANPAETTRSVATLGAASATVVPSPADPALPLAGAAAILPPLPPLLGNATEPPLAAGATELQAKTPGPSGPTSAAATSAAAAPAPPPDVATAQATQILADQAFDRTLDLEPTSQTPPRRHAPETLRRRGWRHREQR
jgi:RND family efflux transporter MFP subunit